MKTKLFTYSAPLILFFALIFSSCKKALGPDMLYAVPTPVISNIATKEADLEVAWEYSDDSNISKFVVQLSYDKNFAAVAKSDSIGATERGYLFKNVNLVTEYYVRVKAVAKNIVLTSDFSSKSLQLESIFKPLVRADVKATNVTLKWDNPVSGSVNNIVLIPLNGSPLAPFQLSTTDKANKTVTITGLSAATVYTALINENDNRKGVISFTTRDINERITINSSPIVYETLQDAVDAANSGDVINFGGAVYDFSGADLETVRITNKSLTLKPEVGSTVTPTITLKNFWLKGNISSFAISGLKIISTSKANTATNTDYNKHIIGVSYVNSTITVTIENSDLSGAESGLIFTQTSTAGNLPEGALSPGIHHLIIRNSLFHDFGNAGGDFIDYRSGTIGNILLENSSFWKLARAFFRTDNTASALGGSKVIINKNTFNSICNGGAFLRTQAPGVDVTLSNNIISNKTSNNNNSISGTGAVVKANNNNTFGTNSGNFTNSISTANNVGNTSLDPQYVDPNNGIFTVGNPTVKAAQQGDPRWLQ
ncbi:hypothetical protein Pedsa_0306 [Pseudopedobacter saltans DSM 12145]|uniref:DUF5123 domain-containing protein n=1 Tax=Pseudopedobacter saltans (strain ATCC 51119 / DSM 12145 / JCM 21818 / CCUG 39354 / LMG 10337 / NBRC 100064 / NCIMB 13643) TaxID=762903 RepID=F0S4D3_PSESL|nr:DUF5123 domain-containing protein [Pseudopedobacter saltans]ADY50890.1 hypothetical protein Pedsa_0306 [Pseudopedobacter saltans DSM 12145]